jgi:hypothetical protein
MNAARIGEFRVRFKVQVQKSYLRVRLADSESASGASESGRWSHCGPRPSEDRDSDAPSLQESGGLGNSGLKVRCSLTFTGLLGPCAQIRGAHTSLSVVLVVE